MSRDSDVSDAVVGVSFAGFVGVVLLGSVSLGMWGCPRYNIYQQEMEGQAQLSKAESTRRFKVLEAQAELDSAKLKAQADIERSKGVAAAADIVITKLGGPQNYLMWNYIEMLKANEHSVHREVIYIPTEGGMPLMEANRLRSTPAPVGGR